MKNVPLRRFLASTLLLLAVARGVAQDNVRGSAEPIVASIDPAKLTYDILVEGNLQRDDPAKLQFKANV